MYSCALVTEKPLDASEIPFVKIRNSETYSISVESKEASSERMVPSGLRMEEEMECDDDDETVELDR